MKEMIYTEEKKDEFVSLASQHEDNVLKFMMQFFSEDILPFLGIEGKVVSAAPTESIHLELKKMFEDFNLIMEDGTWKHFEFQCTDNGVDDLKRFRSYEAVASYTYGVEITTYVLYSGKIRRPVTEFTEGINTYRVIPIIMTDKNADRLIEKLKEKAAQGKPLTKTDLIPLTLCPLMGGESSQKERLLAAYELADKATELTENERRKIEAMIYTMADKFLDPFSMEDLKAVVKMTRLGQMLVNDGIQQGAEKTKLENARNLLRYLDVDEDTIAKCIELPLETVRKLKEEVK